MWFMNRCMSPNSKRNTSRFFMLSPLPIFSFTLSHASEKSLVHSKLGHFDFNYMDALYSLNRLDIFWCIGRSKEITYQTTKSPNRLNKVFLCYFFLKQTLTRIRNYLHECRTVFDRESI